MGRGGRGANRILTPGSPIMDDLGATKCDLLPPPSIERPDCGSLPMYLIVLGGGIPGAMLKLSSGGTRLGRALDNGLHLPERSISRHHAFFKIEDGRAWLTDLGSTNGTFVNGERIVEDRPVLLRDG